MASFRLPNLARVAVLGLAALLLAAPAEGAKIKEWRGLVIRVKDGDTFVVRRRGCEFTVRLFGVDCPELRDKPRGPAAAEFTRSMILGRRVRLLVHGQDRYGRTVAEVLLPGGRDLAEALLWAGLAEILLFSDGPGEPLRTS